MRHYLCLLALAPLACSSVDAGASADTLDDSATGSKHTTATASASGTETGGGSDGLTGGDTDDGGSSTGAASSSASAGETSGGPDNPTTGGQETEDVDVPPGSRIPVAGKDAFLLGANYPWKNYGGDFGGNAWGNYGVHTKPDEFGAQFQQMADGGLQVVRWFVFTDGRAGVIFDNTGTPSGLGEFVLADFDAAIAIARARGVYLVPVLLDFHWMYWAQQEGQVQLGGRSDTITDPVKRAALVDKVVVPLLQAYADEPAILAWEIMNEPEWSIADLPDGAPTDKANAVPLKDFYALASAVADAVHLHTDAYVTLGSASLKWVKAWTPDFAAAHQLPLLDLDFYQAHYYAWMDGQGFADHPDYGTLKFSPMDQDYESLALDRPLVIGELVISDSAGARLDTLLERGYAGVWPWSLNADYKLDLPGIKAWADAHADIVDLPPP